MASASARSVGAVAALAIILIGAAPMAAAAASRTADPILALAIAGNSAPEDYPAPGFQLTDQNGQPVSLASLRGKVVLMTFLDPVCTSDCPIIGAGVEKKGVLLGSADKDVELVAVVANPTYRSVAFTRAFDREEGLDTVPNWLYLSGSLSQLTAVWQHYGVEVQNLPAGAMVAHSDLALVIDRTGHIREETSSDPGPATRHPVLILGPAHPVCPPSAERLVMRRFRPGTVRALLCAGLVPLTSLVAGCGSQTIPATTPSLRVQVAPLSTSLVTPQGTWAVAVMGGSAADENNFWQLFVRPAGATRWSLATPEGVADNGGLVAASGADGTSLLVGFRPSQELAFSPLATSSDTGKKWTPGLLDADLADVPDAIAVARSGQTLALLGDGGIQAATSAAAATAGQWSRLTTPVGPGGVSPGTPVRAGGGERRLVRPR